MNPELTFALRLEGMTRLALITALGALERNESRGAHCRTDFPERDDANWLNRTLATWADGAGQPTLRFEPVGLLDLPPGDRGYGHGDHVPLEVDLETYNRTVAERQREEGSLETVEPMGSRMQWGAWRGTEHTMTPDRSE